MKPPTHKGGVKQEGGGGFLGRVRSALTEKMQAKSEDFTAGMSRAKMGAQAPTAMPMEFAGYTAPTPTPRRKINLGGMSSPV